MRKSLIIETLYKLSIVFRKESFINAKKRLNFLQSHTNEKKVIKSLTVFHTVLSRGFRKVSRPRLHKPLSLNGTVTMYVIQTARISYISILLIT